MLRHGDTLTVGEVSPPPRSLSLKPNVRDHVVGQAGEIQVLLFDNRSPRSERLRAYRIAAYANRETRYDAGVYEPEDTSRERDWHVFIARENGYAIAILVVRHSRMAPEWWAWNKTSAARAKPPPGRSPSSWTAAYAWVLRERRRQGLATLLVHAAAGHFGFERIQDLSWGVPFTPTGARLARKLCPEGFWAAL